MGDATRWFQLYWVNDRDIAASFVARAQAARYSAIVVTLDTSVLGWRPRDLRNAYLPFLRGEGCANFFTDPAFLAKLDKTPEEDPLDGGGDDADDVPEPRADVERPRLAARADRRCRCSSRAFSPPRTRSWPARTASTGSSSRTTADGRWTDRWRRSTRSSRSATRVGPDYPLLLDGGIRRGADVVKAMALGADAVLIGRLYAYGLAVGGADGVEAVIRQLLAEVDLTLALCGGTAIADLDRSLVAG